MTKKTIAVAIFGVIVIALSWFVFVGLTSVSECSKIKANYREVNQKINDANCARYLYPSENKQWKEDWCACELTVANYHKEKRGYMVEYNEKCDYDKYSDDHFRDFDDFLDGVGAVCLDIPRFLN